MMTSQLHFQTVLSSTRISDPIKFFTGDSFDRRKTIESPLDFDAMNTSVRTRFVKENIIALSCEASELLEWMPWKHWKTYQDAEMSLEDIIEARYEVVDMFHFLFNLSFCLGMTPEMVFDGFMRKQEENRDRQKRGY
jgi:dimeric dUTPase (all-alpha-NTP-PPase superfamily)